MTTVPEGERPILVFIHGGGVGPWMWADQAAHFSNDYTVFTPTLPGHDLRGPGYFSMHTEAARTVAQAIGLPGLSRPVTAIGFSLGGQTAMQLAACYPGQVERLVVVSSLLRPWPGAAALGLLAAASAPLSRSRRFAQIQATQLAVPAGMFEDYYALSRSIPARTIRRLVQANFSFSVPDTVLGSAMPALLMAGDKEDSRLLRAMETVHTKMRNSSLQVHPGVGHDMPLARSRLFNASLRHWLETVPSA